MKNIKLRKTTTELNAIRGPKGLIAYNTDDGSIRIYDGDILGGWSFLGDPIEFPIPGPSELIAGNETTGFYGEVASTELFTRSDLLAAVGISSGSLMTTEDTWLKFALDGKTLFVHKTGVISSASRSGLLQLNLVYPTESVTLTLSGLTYRVRLLNGIDQNPTSVTRGQDNPTETAGSEWNRLIYPIHESDIDGAGWGINYTNSDIQVGLQNKTGTLIQESHIDYPSAQRGYSSVGWFGASILDDDPNNIWRPVLEVVQ